MFSFVSSLLNITGPRTLIKHWLVYMINSRKPFPPEWEFVQIMFV